MDLFSAVNAFVPAWIFLPLLLVGVVTLFTTPKVGGDLDRASQSAERPHANAR